MPMVQCSGGFCLYSRRIYAADEALDADAFAAILSPGLGFQMGSAPSLSGQKAARDADRILFSTLRTVRSQLVCYWAGNGKLVFQSDVTLGGREGLWTAHLPDDPQTRWGKRPSFPRTACGADRRQGDQPPHHQCVGRSQFHRAGQSDQTQETHYGGRDHRCLPDVSRHQRGRRRLQCLWRD